MKVFSVRTGFDYTQNHCVVADSMGEAERIFKAKYRPTTIRTIELYSEYVQVQGFDEQAKKDGIE